MSGTIGGGAINVEDGWTGHSIVVPDQYTSPIKYARNRRTRGLTISASYKLQVIFSRTT